MIAVHTIKVDYETFGYVHLKGIVEEASCQQLILRMRELVAKKSPKDSSKIFDADHQKTETDFLIDSAKDISCFFDKNAYQKGNIPSDPFKALNKVGHALHELCPVYKKFSQKALFFDLVKILGQEKPRLVQSMFIFKQPKFGDGVPAHQDATFIHSDPCSVVGLWFALEDATIENGCLWVLPGAHQGPLKERFVYKRGKVSFENKERVCWPRKDFVALPAKRGDVIVLHGRLPHLSEQNRSSLTRHAYTLHFIDQKSHFPKSCWLNQ